jgi:hypothetical protein
VMHSSTFGGNPLASAVGIAALEVVGEQDLCKRYLFQIFSYNEFSTIYLYYFYSSPKSEQKLLFERHRYFTRSDFMSKSVLPLQSSVNQMCICERRFLDMIRVVFIKSKNAVFW